MYSMLHVKYIACWAVFIETYQFVNISLLVVQCLISPGRQVVKIKVPFFRSFCPIWEAKLHRTRQQQGGCTDQLSVGSVDCPHWEKQSETSDKSLCKRWGAFYHCTEAMYRVPKLCDVYWSLICGQILRLLSFSMLQTESLDEDDQTSESRKIWKQ